MRNEDDIKLDILNRISDDIDKREGSIIDVAVGPISNELAIYELQHEYDVREAFIGTATGGNLDLLASDFGYARELATPVTVKAEIIGAVIDIMTRFSAVDVDIIYYVTGAIGNNLYTMEAEDVSEQANTYTSNLLPIDVVNNLISAKIIKVIVPQKETETDEEFRERVRSSLIAEATDGNVAQYKKWCADYDGVGKGKIFPIWNGVNTVKVSILNELSLPASDELIQTFQSYLDPNSAGLGNGQAPIGAKVIVTTATSKVIDVYAKVAYKDGYTNTHNLEQEIRKLFADLAYSGNMVGVFKVATTISGDEAIDTVLEVKLNNGVVDILLQAEEVPVLGVLNVVT